jgi:HEAT repeat protein
VAVPALAEALAGDNEDVRFRAAQSLIQYRRAGRPAIPVFVRTLNDSDYNNRVLAAMGLAGFGADAKEAVPALTASLRQDKDNRVRYRAAEALGAIGPDAASALPVLKDALHDRAPEVRLAAAAALKKIEPGTSAPR